jgi:hypothetical protein
MSEKRGRGQPKFDPTPDQRSQIKLIKAMGIPEDRICQTITNPRTRKPVAPMTLARAFAAELASGATEVHAHVGNFIICAILGKKPALGEAIKSEQVRMTAAIFYAKTRMGWKETVVNEPANKDDKPFVVDDARQRHCQLSGLRVPFSGLARLERGSTIGEQRTFRPEPPRHRQNEHTTGGYVDNAALRSWSIGRFNITPCGVTRRRCAPLCDQACIAASWRGSPSGAMRPPWSIGFRMARQHHPGRRRIGACRRRVAVRGSITQQRPSASSRSQSRGRAAQWHSNNRWCREPVSAASVSGGAGEADNNVASFGAGPACATAFSAPRGMSAADWHAG